MVRIRTTWIAGRWLARPQRRGQDERRALSCGAAGRRTRVVGCDSTTGIRTMNRTQSPVTPARPALLARSLRVERLRPFLRPTLFSLLALVGVVAPVAAQQPVFPLDTLRVDVASRAATTVAASGRTVQVITAAQIRRLPVRTVAGVLQWATGVDLRARSPAQADVGIRGASAEQVLVLVDGVRVSDPQTAHFALDLTPSLDQIQRIEILRGPASALYGSDAVGGVINIVTRQAGGPALAGSLDGGAFGTLEGALRGGGDVGRLSLRGGGELRRSDGFRPGTDYRIAQIHGAAATSVGRRALRLEAGWAQRSFGARAFYTPPAADFNEHERTRATTAVLSLAAPPGARVSIEPRLSVRRHDDDFVLLRDNPSFYHNVHHSWQIGGDVIGRLRAAGARVALGAEAYRNLLRSNELGDRSESRAALFGEARAGHAGAETVNVGLRGDWYSRYGAFLAPSLAGTLWLDRAWSLRASVGRAFRAPTWTERYYRDPSNIGNPDLRPERSWSAELGARWTRGIARVGLDGFVRGSRDLIDWVRPAGAAPVVPWQARNIGRATFQGLEARATILDPTGTRWSLAATALRFSADRAPGTESKYALRPLRHTLILTAERPLVAGLSLTARVMHARRQGDAAYLRADARLQEHWRGGRIYLDVQNLTNADYLDVSGLPAPGRAAYIGLALSRGH